MRQITLAFSILLLAAAASAQTPEVHIQPFPFLGTVFGGDHVTLTISGVRCNDFRQNFSVRFGGTLSPFSRAGGTDCRTILAITPPHAPGVVSVSVTINDITYTSERAFTYTGLGTDPQRVNYEQVLVPLPIPAPDMEIPGANGARWVTEAFVHNGSTRYLELFHSLRICDIIVCHGTDPYPGFQPGTHRLPPMDRPSLWYVQKSRSEDATFSMQVYDRSRAHENSGSEVPIVRERDFRMNAIHLPRVPITAAGRTSLRIYLIEKVILQPPLRIRIFRSDDASAAPVAERTIVPAAVSDPGFPESPTYFFLGDLRTEFPQLRDGMHRIEISVDSEITPLWAMASVANDTTNLVTIYSPQ